MKTQHTKKQKNTKRTILLRNTEEPCVIWRRHCVYSSKKTNKAKDWLLLLLWSCSLLLLFSIVYTIIVVVFVVLLCGVCVLFFLFVVFCFSVPFPPDPRHTQHTARPTHTTITHSTHHPPLPTPTSNRIKSTAIFCRPRRRDDILLTIVRYFCGPFLPPLIFFFSFPFFFVL